MKEEKKRTGKKRRKEGEKEGGMFFLKINWPTNKCRGNVVNECLATIITMINFRRITNWTLGRVGKTMRKDRTFA